MSTVRPVGAMDTRITIQRRTVTRDALGGEAETWTTWAERWAEELPQGGREFWAARQVTAELTSMLRTWYVPGTTPGMRVVIGSRTLDILAVTPEPAGRPQWMLLSCREAVAP